MKRFEVHYDEAMEINAEISEEFHPSKCNSDTVDYVAIQKRIEEKHGEGSLMLAFRALATRCVLSNRISEIRDQKSHE